MASALTAGVTWALAVARWAIIAVVVALLATPLVLETTLEVRILEVTGGSMAPTYYPGDLIVIDGRVGGEVRPGDVVTVRRPTGVLYTHRVDTILPNGAIVTRGDANPVPDTPAIGIGDIQGVVRARIAQPWAGCLAAASSLPGRLSLALVLVGLVGMPAALRRVRSGAAAPDG